MLRQLRLFACESELVGFHVVLRVNDRRLLELLCVSLGAFHGLELASIEHLDGLNFALRILEATSHCLVVLVQGLVLMIVLLLVI